MSSLIPISTYNLALEPFNPQPALDDEFPVTIRLTMAAVDPEAVDDKEEPSTVRILKKSRAFLDDDEDDLLDIEAEEDDELDEEEEEGKIGKKVGKKDKKDEDENKKDDEDDDDEEDDEDSDLDDDDEIEEFVLCTLSPKVQFQQTLDLTISPDEEVYFVATGSYSVHLTGNYVEHPADEEDSEDDDECYSDEDDEDAFNLTPDEDELVNRLEDVSDVEGIIEELVEKEANNKRAAEGSSESKKNKKAKEEKKKVQFTEKLEQGPTPSKKEKKKAEKADRADKDESGKTEDKKDKKFSTKTLLGGVVIEDRKVGSGASAKAGNKVGIRYIGKLKTGKVFDKNTSGNPFVFKLGMGECIKGFDLGVAGMAVGGERRVIIPAKMGYGSQSLPGIPANSELTFDIKLVSLK
ncbi:hypothetical protein METBISCDRAFT_14819 [Metschnikowia bicuspidata]|uniref:FK506-binding protein n=1 Tax=Metschnikowia bicuspidata TaxID=27322 RepID=A0A4P9ZDQ5_9ASCO|nr:hypothetical protein METBISCDRAFT_14819 [Metschnikowia bicuspidata]